MLSCKCEFIRILVPCRSDVDDLMAHQLVPETASLEQGSEHVDHTAPVEASLTSSNDP